MNEESKTNKQNLISEEILETLQKGAAHLDRVRAKLENSVSDRIKDFQQTEEKLDLFYRNVEELEKQLAALPSTVEIYLEEAIETNMKKLSDHTFKEMKEAGDSFVSETKEMCEQTLKKMEKEAVLHTEEFKSLTNSCRNSLDKVKNRIGWRGYLAPILSGFVAFGAACGVSWWMKQNMMHFNEDFVRTYRNGVYLNTALRGLSEDNHKNTIELLQKGNKNWEENLGER